MLNANDYGKRNWYRNTNLSHLAAPETFIVTTFSNKILKNTLIIIKTNKIKAKQKLKVLNQIKNQL